MSRVPPPSSSSSSTHLSTYRRLTPRDRLLLSWLAEHYLLSTHQIARALFDSTRTAQQRLTVLHRLNVLHRFTFANPNGSPETPYLYTLGPVGMRLHPDAYHDPDQLSKLHALMEAVRQDIPHTTPILPKQLEDFERELEAPYMHLDRYWIARDGDRIVGHSFLCFPPEIGPAAEKAGVPFVPEGYVDLDYDASGKLVLERVKQLRDPEAMGERALRLIRAHRVPTVEGGELELEVESICVHGDAPNAPEIARAIRETLGEAEIELVPLADLHPASARATNHQTCPGQVP